MTPCTACGAPNPEAAQYCGRCGAALSEPPTMSVSSVGTAPRKPRSHSPTLGFAPGSIISERYRVISLLGRGGMGEVYGADDLKLGQRVALKFLPTHRAHDSSWRDQFYAEVRIARQISHPNVCRVYDVGESDGRLFLSMEFVDGEDLASLLRRIGRLPDDKAVEVARQLCAGLAAAHGAGVLHRDLKPSNVMLDGKGRARITDFGLAIAVSDANGERPAGTPGYMAPELMKGAAPTVQSDLYALGLVLYEVFTGKRVFDSANLAELYREQSETNPKPPSNLIKNFDPAVERVILRCLDRDPVQRPRSSHSVAAALPGGDPLAAAVAAGETPSPEMVAAAGPQGSLPPAVAWMCLIASLLLIFGTAIFIAPHATDWGLAPMPKSPEVLADRAEELATRLRYSKVVDRAYWVDRENDYSSYAVQHPASRDWKRTSPDQVWPSTVNFWYRQSPDWMEPASVLESGNSPPRVGPLDPPFEKSGMVAIKLDMRGSLLLLRAVPQQVDTGNTPREPDWNMLFAEAGLDKARFSTASPKWTPPDAFDSRADWEGSSAERPDLLLHITAAAYRGVPVYFQVIAPWDKPWRETGPPRSGIQEEISSLVWASIMVGLLVVGGFFAHRNIRRGRGDLRGAWRLAVFAALLNTTYALFNYRYIPRPEYIVTQFILLGVPLLFAVIFWIGYMAVEPYARRMWPDLMVSWQRLLNGRLRDPLVGRHVLLGILAGAAVAGVLGGVNGLIGLSEVAHVRPFFGRGFGPSVGWSAVVLSSSFMEALTDLALLTILTGMLRKRWLGLVATGLLLGSQIFLPNALDMALTAVYVVVFLFVFTQLGLVATASFLSAMEIFSSPPLNFSQWYAGRALIALMVPVALLVYGFYTSLGNQPVLGKALEY